VERLLTEIWRQIEEFEQQCSRFRADSELSELNRHAGEQTPVSAELREILLAARLWATESGGLFNPLMLPALQRAGYLGDWNNPTEGQVDVTDRQIAPAEQIEIGSDWARLPAGSAADLGGIGKGYLLDKLGNYLDSRGVANYWLSLGGDVLVAGRDIGAPGWTVEVAAADGGQPELIENRGRRLAIATSGITKRRGEDNGRSWHHLIDPRTGAPAATDVLTATVTAASATAAEILAKCLVIGGSAAAPGFWRQHSSRAEAESVILQLKPGSARPRLKLT
jgi:thiamine biosynthesis lipoprotein